MVTRIFSVMKNMQKVIYCLVSLILIALGLSSVMDIPEVKADAGSIYSVSHINDIFISSGEAGTLSSSVDGEVWNSITRPFGLNSNVNEVSYGNGTYVGVSDAGTIVTSPDAINWTTRASGESSDLMGIIFNEDKFVVVGHYGTILTSTNGVNWDKQVSNVTDNLSAVTYGKGMFVAVGQNGLIMTSRDGESWSNSSVPGGSLTDITFGNDMFLIVAASVWTSVDGEVWTQKKSPGAGRVSYGDGKFMIVVRKDVFSSNDGENWATYVKDSEESLFDVVYGNGIFVVVGNNNTRFIPDVTARWQNYITGASNPSFDGLTAVAYGKGMYVAVGNYGNLATSPDGASWTWRPALDTSYLPLQDVIYDGGKFVTVGDTGRILSSVDGITWTNHTDLTKFKEHFKSIAYGNGQYIAAGVNHMIYNSTDLENWTYNSSLSEAFDTHSNLTVDQMELYKIKFIDGNFLVIGSPDIAYISSNGNSWTPLIDNEPGVVYDYLDSIYVDGKYLIVGNLLGTIKRSDGVTFMENIEISTREIIYGISYSNGNYVAVGYYGLRLTSTNGLDWKPDFVSSWKPDNSNNDRILGIASHNGTFVAVGTGGKISRYINVDLSGLTVTDATISPAFSPDKAIYTASVAHSVSSITISPVAVDTKLSVKVNGVLNSGAPQDINLNVGVNRISVVIMAADNQNSRTYTILVTREAQTPVVVTEPAGTTVIIGDASPTLSAAATTSDGGTLGFQWYSNTTDSHSGGSLISGASSETYSPPTDTVGTKYYYVVVTNTNAVATGTKLATATSRIAEVVVIPTEDTTTPVISTQPSGVTVTEGDTNPTLTILATSSDAGTLSYQWYSNTTDSETGATLISDATSSTYSAPTGSVGTTYYYVEVTNTNAAATGAKSAKATSSRAAVVVNAPVSLVDAVTPAIGTQPAGSTVLKDGSSPTLSVAATTSDAGTLGYQWYSNTTDSETGATLISDATSSTYSAPTGSVGTTYYYVEVTNTNAAATGAKSAKATSSRAAVVVNAPVSLVDAVTPAIGTQPAGSTVLKDGSSPSLSVVATTSDAGTLGYQWYSNTTDSETGATLISEATSSTYDAPTGSVGTTYYYVEVTNTNAAATGAKSAKVTSSRAAVVVNAALVEPVDAATPVVGTQPTGTTVVKDGATPTLSVIATTSDAGALSYQWYSNTTDSETGATLISDATSSTYSAPTGSVGTTYYYVEVTNTNAAATGAKSAKVTSSRAAVIVNELTYTVNFNTVGGSTITRLTDITEGSLLSEPAAPTKAGYTFEGWYKEASYTTPWDYKTDTITADTTLFANWKLKSGGTVGGGGSISTPDNSEVISTEGSIALPVGKSGRVSLENAITISIPANVSDIEMILTIEEILDRDWMESKSEVEMFISPIFEILKNFTGNFNHPITLTFTFDRAALKTNQTPEVFYYDEVKKEWVQVQGGKINGNTITVEVDHLTKFSVMAVSHGEQESEPEQPTFSDVIGHWAATNINKATQVGIVKGYENGTFKPNNAVTRAEFVVMLMNALNPQDTEATNLTFTDKADIGAWAITAIENAVQSGIINGYSDGTLRPNDKITRTEMAVMIAKALSLNVDGIAVTNFADDAEIPSWAKGQVAALQKLAIISGKGHNAFAPNDQATRAEAVTMLLNLMAQESK